MVVSMAHGRNYLINTGKNTKREVRRDRRATFRTQTPDGRKVRVTLNVRGTFQEPCVIFSNETGEWRAKAALDKNSLPEWVNNYKVMEAVEIK